MAFRCPQCKTRDSLEIVCSIQLPPDSRCDDIALQVVGCSGCCFRGLSVYEEARGDTFESETWHHTGFWVSPDAVESVEQAIASCPEPFNGYCTCQAHQSLGQKDLRGAWSGLAELERGHTFLMRLAI